MYVVTIDPNPHQGTLDANIHAHFRETLSEAETLAREISEEEGHVVLIMKIIGDADRARPSHERTYVDPCVARGVQPGIDFPVTLNAARTHPWQ